jgi:predicted O-linked N-acetylglucosamine transferase (SPINDLY family)
MRRRLLKAFDRFVDLTRVSFKAAAERIKADGVDILVDLKGYTRHARTEIMALRPAAIQVSYLGYPGTMAAPFIDYIVVDDFIVPPDQQPYFTEQLVYLPCCYQVNDSRRQIAERAPTRAECGLPDVGFVFCCFNSTYKITSWVFDVWMQLLKEVPGSVLWLLDDNPCATANLRKEAEARCIPGHRLVFAPRLDPPEHLARHRLADLFLDTLPVNAHTTASDALWAGCLLLTVAGQTFPSRVAGSLLRTMGLPELISASLQEYLNTALRLAEDRGFLDSLRARLQANRASGQLFDGSRFARDLEQVYDRLWQKHISRQSDPRTPS